MPRRRSTSMVSARLWHGTGTLQVGDAATDGLIKRNPCQIKGAYCENSPERPVLTMARVYVLADVVGLCYRALILLAAFTSLCWAELAALGPKDIDLDARTVRVTRQPSYHELAIRSTAVRLRRLVSDLRPDRDSNAGPTA